LAKAKLKRSVDNDLMLIVKVRACLNKLYIASWHVVGEQLKLHIPSDTLIILRGSLLQCLFECLTEKSA
jgi:hypothetical protein